MESCLTQPAKAIENEMTTTTTTTATAARAYELMN